TDAASARNPAAVPPLGRTTSTASHETRPDSKSGAAKPAKRSRKNRNHKRRHRRQSFLAPGEEEEEEERRPEVQQPLKAATAPSDGPDSVASAVAAGADQQQPKPLKSRSKPTRDRLPFYGLGNDLSSVSETSLESEALLD